MIRKLRCLKSIQASWKCVWCAETRGVRGAHNSFGHNQSQQRTSRNKRWAHVNAGQREDRSQERSTPSMVPVGMRRDFSDSPVRGEAELSPSSTCPLQPRAAPPAVSIPLLTPP